MRLNRAPLRRVWAIAAVTSVACVPSARTLGEAGTMPPQAGSGQADARDHQEQTCVVDGDSLRMLTITRSPTTGDSLVGGVAFRTAHPTTYPPYIATAPWYVTHEPVRFGPRVYGSNHPPQVIAPELLKFLGRYRGVPVFRAADEAVAAPTIIYLPVRPGCVFQPLTGLAGHDEPG
jgi:hypothetical protein